MSSARHLATLLDCPTAPFHEDVPLQRVLQFAQDRGLPASRDAWGNVSVAWDGHGARMEGPPLALVAGLDHPGGEVLAVAGDTAEVAWHGEVLAEYLSGAWLRIHGRQGSVAAEVTSIVTRPGALGDVPDRLLVESGDRVQVGDIVTLDLPALAQEGSEIRARGALAPIGAAALLDLLERLTALRVACVVQCFFTRGSSVGFAGTQGLLERGLLMPGQTVIAVHGVGVQPGAMPGAGPVLRLGDACSLFDADVVRVLDRAAVRFRENFPEAGLQRAVLPHGASDAGLLALQQRRVAALCVPIQNPLNMGPRGVPEPESFHLQDYLSLVDLLETVAVDWDGALRPDRLRTESRQWLTRTTTPSLVRLGMQR